VKRVCGDDIGKFDFGDSKGKCYILDYKHDLVKIVSLILGEIKISVRSEKLILSCDIDDPTLSYNIVFNSVGNIYCHYLS